MKSISNRKVQRGAFVSWYMTRQIAGKEFRQVLHLSPEQILQGRSSVARRLLDARASMQAAIRGQS